MKLFFKFQERSEVGTGDRGGVGGDLLRGALRDDAASVTAPCRAHVEEVVHGLEYVQVVFDDDDSVAALG